MPSEERNFGVYIRNITDDEVKCIKPFTKKEADNTVENYKKNREYGRWNEFYKTFDKDGKCYKIGSVLLSNINPDTNEIIL